MLEFINSCGLAETEAVSEVLHHLYNLFIQADQQHMDITPLGVAIFLDKYAKYADMHADNLINEMEVGE